MGRTAHEQAPHTTRFLVMKPCLQGPSGSAYVWDLSPWIKRMSLVPEAMLLIPTLAQSKMMHAPLNEAMWTMSTRSRAPSLAHHHGVPPGTQIVGRGHRFGILYITDANYSVQWLKFLTPHEECNRWIFRKWAVGVSQDSSAGRNKANRFANSRNFLHYPCFCDSTQHL
jgi:hypothetical protein